MTFLITGCSSGLGFELVKSLLKEKNNVIGFSRNIGKCEQFSGNKKFRFISVDLGSPENIHKTLQNPMLANLKDINLILNAGIFKHESKMLGFNEDTSNIFQVNYFSCIDFVAFFKEKDLTRVLFINSIAGISSFKEQSQYCASKHAQLSFAKTLQKESVGQKYDVMVLNPGGIKTELWNKTKMLDSKKINTFLDPYELALFINHMLKLPSKTYIETLTIIPESDI
jgi:short-subunit dehydrogenase